MSKYLDELDSDLEDLKDRVKYAIDSFDNMKEDFDHMQWQIDDIKTVLKSRQTAEEKLDEIDSIIRR